MSSSNGHSTGGLSRAEILAAQDMKLEAIEVPEWGGTVYVRNMTGKARDAFERSRFKMVGDKFEVIHANTRASLLAVSICNAQGQLLFTPEDIEALGEKNGAILDRLFDVAQRLSGLRKEDVEARIKNLNSAPSDSSGTVSR